MEWIPKCNIKSDEVGLTWKANTWIRHNKEASDERWLQEWITEHVIDSPWDGQLPV